MKKMISSLVAALSIFLLAACQPTSSTEKATEEQTATVTIEFENKTDTKEIHFEKGDSVMDVLEETHSIKDDKGLVTEIDGVSQNPSSNTYWMYKVNDEVDSKGAEEQTVSDGDTITFYLETFQ